MAEGVEGIVCELALFKAMLVSSVSWRSLAICSWLRTALLTSEV